MNYKSVKQNYNQLVVLSTFGAFFAVGLAETALSYFGF